MQTIKSSSLAQTWKKVGRTRALCLSNGSDKNGMAGRGDHVYSLTQPLRLEVRIGVLALGMAGLGW